jgi:hypothetical protein
MRRGMQRWRPIGDAVLLRGKGPVSRRRRTQVLGRSREPIGPTPEKRLREHSQPANGRMGDSASRLRRLALVDPEGVPGCGKIATHSSPCFQSTYDAQSRPRGLRPLRKRESACSFYGLIFPAP